MHGTATRSPLTMLDPGSEKPATRVEIRFEPFPCGPCAVEAEGVLRSLSGVVELRFDPTVCRLAVLFDPARINIPRILSTLESLGLVPRVISVINPVPGALAGKERHLHNRKMRP